MFQHSRMCSSSMLLLTFACGCTMKPDAVQGPHTPVPQRAAEKNSVNRDVATKAAASEPAAQGDVDIDLSVHAKKLGECLERSIARFTVAHPDVEVSCIGFYVDTYGTGVYICYDTQQHSEDKIKEHEAEEDAEYTIGHDEAGPFWKEPNTFKYPALDYFEPQGLPDYYEAKWPLKFRGFDGNVKIVDSYNEDVGWVLIGSFEPALKAFTGFGNLKRAEVFRMGITVHDTPCEVFWRASGKSDPPE